MATFNVELQYWVYIPDVEAADRDAAVAEGIRKMQQGIVSVDYGIPDAASAWQPDDAATAVTGD